MRHNFSVSFKLIHFLLWKKGSHQSPKFDTFDCPGKNLPNSSCDFPNHKSVFLQTLQHFSVKVQTFKNFECSGQNSLNSCHFWNNKSVFLQILHHSSVSWDITPLYLFSWNFIYILSTKKAHKNGNLVKFFVSSQKSEILHFDGLLLSKSWTGLAKKVQKSYLSWHWIVMQSFKKNWLVVSNMT